MNTLADTENDLPLGGHVFQPTGTIVELIQEIIGTILGTKMNLRLKNAPPSGGHGFQATRTIFKLVQDIIATNLLTTFHDDQTINVASRVLTRTNTPPSGDISKASRVTNATPLGSHVFPGNVTIFELIQDIIDYK
ncbi:hypothetical protein DPMN_137195 [Dreissena polymorpha]|uniref:Uncharacterized protein n=1 Tax=Dreissena polymorpha TaxID=45954 RepID=A0A9D4JDE6_DREPO|nr:hypothetical protein DPMN_137195 [Dreissena polymorpha]